MLFLHFLLNHVQLVLSNLVPHVSEISAETVESFAYEIDVRTQIVDLLPTWRGSYEVRNAIFASEAIQIHFVALGYFKFVVIVEIHNLFTLSTFLLGCVYIW